MAFVIVTVIEVIGECVEGLKVKVSREILKMVLVRPGFLGFALSGPSLDLLPDCVECNGVRYWRVDEPLLWDVEETKKHPRLQGL